MQQNTNQVITINVSNIHPHPKNPRFQLRLDVIEGIKAGLQDGFQQHYSITVRPYQNSYQIISGHHRFEAAKQQGINELPCWVVEMDDESAYMELVKSNSQGELSNLEIGVHAFNSEYIETGKRTKGGGLACYAKEIGKSKQTLSDWVSAAKVYSSLVVHPGVQLDNKMKHLNEISKIPKELWQLLVDKMLSSVWSKNDTIYWVSKVKEFEIEDEWKDVFILSDVVKRFIETKEFSPQTVKKIINQCNSVIDLINSYDVDRVAYKKSFITFVSDQDNWDYRKILQQFNVLQVELDSCVSDSFYYLSSWEDRIKELKNESVSVFLSDPPYGINYKSDYVLDRRQERKHDSIKNDGFADAMNVFSECVVRFKEKLKNDAHLFVFTTWKTEHEMINILIKAGYKVRGSLIWVKNNTGMGDPNTTFAPKHERIIHAVKGSPILYVREPDVLEHDRINSENHPTEKPVDLLERLIKTASVEGELIVDPFSGVASTLVAAKNLNRKYWGCEIESKYHAIGEGRLYD